MTTAAFVRLIFLKDVRALRYPLVLLLMLVLAVIFSSEGMHQGLESTSLPGSIFVFLLMTGTLLLTVQLMLADPAGREFRFLLTRPVPGSAVGLAKALFLAAFVIVPYMLSLEFEVGYAQVPLTPLDHLLLLAETVSSFGALLAFLVLLCVFLRNGILVIITVAILRFSTGMLISRWQEYSWRGGVLTSPNLPDLEHERLAHLGAFLGEMVFLVVALVAIGWRYRTKRLVAPLILAFGGYALSLLASFCPYDFAQSLEDQSSKRSLLTPDKLSQIHMTLVTPRGRQHPYDLNGGGWNNINYVLLNSSVQFEGLEPPYYVQTVDYHAVITLRSGKTIVSNYADSNAHGGVGGLNPSFMAVVAGVLPSWPYHKEQVLDLAFYVPRNLPDEALTGATVKGVITLDVRRAYVAGSVPLRTHASFCVPRRRYEIASADFSDDTVKVSLNKFQVPLVLRDDLINRNSMDDLPWLAVYRPFIESLWQTSSSGGSVNQDFIVHVSQPEATYKSVDKDLVPGWRPLPPDWASGAELVFIGSDPCGRITLPYEIDNVDLNYQF